MRLKCAVAVMAVLACGGVATADPVLEQPPTDISQAVSEAPKSRWDLNDTEATEPMLELDNDDSALINEKRADEELADIRKRARELNAPTPKRKSQKGVSFGVKVDSGTTKVPN